ncbi:MAG: CRISPR-associated ring nuclease Crn3/Csx3 [bacterium]|nr:CRISPR-associated ring nuclease Crn3/Csx3 [bacterium]MDW8163244.1 CRISPR-associated ring nuclease Crn3/Csx3 [Candidatus Omnitrophota bacterium]
MRFERDTEIINIPDRIWSPEDLNNFIKDLPPAGGTKGVVLSGRAPVWVYAFLTHYFHPRPFVATFDPRLNGAVVVCSHTPDVKVGEIIKVME